MIEHFFTAPIFLCRLWWRKTIQPPCGRGNASPFGGWRHMDKPLWGLRVQAPFGARVQRVQRVHRVVVGASNL